MSRPCWTSSCPCWTRRSIGHSAPTSSEIALRARDLCKGRIHPLVHFPPLMVSLSNHVQLRFSPSFDKLRMSGARGCIDFAIVLLREQGTGYEDKGRVLP